ncbi:hypothetical protein V6N12_067895 [Hibiscus sabdariffa]|uniref:Uncharacterized protein n=1 Tax=Hibiscus sabdariffa TaxID=183260 RepID=A0ABR2FND0_9ROSI
MLRFYLCKGFNNLLEQDDKGDVSAETTGPAPAEALSVFLFCLGRESRQVSASRQMSSSASFWVSSFGAASVQLLSLRFCCLYIPPRSLSSRQIT